MAEYRGIKSRTFVVAYNTGDDQLAIKNRQYLVIPAAAGGGGTYTGYSFVGTPISLAALALLLDKMP